MAFQLARWCQEQQGTPWSKVRNGNPPGGDNPRDLLFSSSICDKFSLGTYVLDVLWGQWIKLILIQNCVKIKGTTFFSLKSFPLIASGPQKYKHKIVIYFSASKKVRGIFLIIKIRVIFAIKCFLKIEIFWGHEVLKLYFKC